MTAVLAVPGKTVKLALAPPPFNDDADGRNLIYLAGHSLGLQPKSASRYVEEELQDWRRLGVLGHHHAGRPWISYHEALAAPLAALVGAGEDEVVTMNSLTVNLHLMMATFFRPSGVRRRVLMEKSSFPSDRYAVISQLHWHGLDAGRDLIEVQPRAGERTLRTEDLVAAIERAGAELALVLMPGVQYLTGQFLELPPLIAAAHRVGASIGLDLAHAVGNVPLELHDWNADFAVWCSYKYLNAGPGAVGGCFVHQRHARDDAAPRLAGWWGQSKAIRFAMGPDFLPIVGAEGWQVSNPPILSTAPLLASLQIFERAQMRRLRQKSLDLSAYLERLLAELPPGRIDIISPDEAGRRGCQVSLRLNLSPHEAKLAYERLAAAGIVGDWREPDIMRWAPVPLYNSFTDVFKAVAALTRAIPP
ncbi:MAG: kynureninase [Steroidobacteraceae bacterium]